MIFFMSLMDGPATPLRRLGLLLLQAISNVRGCHHAEVSACSGFDDVLRYHHDRPYRDHHNQRMYVRSQLQPRTEAAHQPQEDSFG